MEQENTEFLNAYLTAALWSSNDESTPDGGNPIDENYAPEDLHPDALDLARRDCLGFLNRQILGHSVAAFLGEDKMEQAGHDFWLTRNGHGAGFWDNPDVYGTYGAHKLSDLAKSYGELNLTVGDDGILYLE